MICEVFGRGRTEDGLPGYEFAVVAGEPGPLRSETGFTMQTEFGLDWLESADLIAVPALADDRMRCGRHDPPALLDALRRNVARGARVLSVCTGAFVLAAAGLLDGMRWLIGQRILLARELPEQTDDTVAVVAERAGSGNATALRHHCRAWRSTTPREYRRTFRPSVPARITAAS